MWNACLLSARGLVEEPLGLGAAATLGPVLVSMESVHVENI